MDKFTSFSIARATQFKTRLSSPEPVPRLLLSVMSHSSPFSWPELPLVALPSNSNGPLGFHTAVSFIKSTCLSQADLTCVSTLESVTPKLTPNGTLPRVPHLEHRAPRACSEPSPPEASCLLPGQGKVKPSYHLSHMSASWGLAWTISPEVCTPSSASGPSPKCPGLTRAVLASPLPPHGALCHEKACEVRDGEGISPALTYCRLP